MGRCIACDPAVTEAEHAAVIDQVRRFFEGRVGEIAAELKQKMKQAAADMLFEKAARYRDQITQIEHVLEKQQAVMTDAEDRDVFGFALLRTKALVQLFKVRHGLLLGRETFTLDCAADCDPAEVLERTLTDYYERANEIPREVLLPVDFDGMIELESWLKDKRSDLLAKPSALELRMPQRGDKLQIVELANKNAEEQIKELMDQWLSTEQKKRLALKELQEALELPRRPERIECYDISHFGGEGTVASMVVMENGEPKKSDYRKFKMRHVSGGDDYAAMQEVFARRFDYLRESGIRLEGLTMRQASPKDMQAIAAVVAAENLDGEGMAPEQFVALKHAGEVIGFGRLRAYPLNAEDAKKYGDTNLTEIASLWVKPEMRGKKFGYKLLAELIKRAGSKVQYVIVPEALADYYAGFGFKKVTSPPPVLAAKETACASARGGARFVTLRFDKTIHRKADLSFKAIPDLVVVDGGKGQLSVTVAVLEFLGIAQKEDPPKAAKAPKKAKPASTPAKPAKPRSRWKRFTFPIVGLAKQAEEIFVPGEPLPVQLAADTQASLLLQAIRDEAHRFANTYQQKVRTKARLG
jgi:excinuclease UvrABC nuclease subunit